MHQLNKVKSVIFHLYPGIFITLGFIILAPLSIKYGFPPQFGMLLAIILVALPLLLLHLFKVKKQENRKSIFALNGYTNKLPKGKLILYSIALVIFAFTIWGITAPMNKVITEKLLFWLPNWFTVQDFVGYDKSKIGITLVLNLVFNGVLAPYIEEFYFRGYLLARMKSWGKYAFIINAVLFSLYHFWQPYIYLTLIVSLLPMTFLVWKTKDLRLSILTHCLLNLIGALLSFGLLK
jgi:membrane protease YdiL (CAAX protease family)